MSSSLEEFEKRFSNYEGELDNVKKLLSDLQIKEAGSDKEMHEKFARNEKMMKSIDDSLTGLSEDVNKLRLDFLSFSSANKIEIATIKAVVETLSDDISTLSANVKTQQESLDALKTSLDSLSKKNTSIEERIGKLEESNLIIRYAVKELNESVGTITLIAKVLLALMVFSWLSSLNEINFSALH